MSAGDLAARVLAGEVRAGARVMRELDDRTAQGFAALRTLYPHTGKAFVVGITGPPGSGKSTLVDGLIGLWREAGRRVGVVAVDPTSPISGGAMLGDRVRMQRHAVDAGVFIRSLATRGHLGGLSRSTADVVAVMDAMGYDPVIVETVGVGQDEVEVVGTADLTCVVTVPGLGDGMQAMKSGLMEVADIFVVNKSDREGSDRTVTDLEAMLSLRQATRSSTAPLLVLPPILRTAAINRSGLGELVSVIDGMRPTQGPEAALRLTTRRRARARDELGRLLGDLLRERLLADLAAKQLLEPLLDELTARRVDPYTAAEHAVRTHR